MYHVSAQGVDERMINVHYYYYIRVTVLQVIPQGKNASLLRSVFHNFFK